MFLSNNAHFTCAGYFSQPKQPKSHGDLESSQPRFVYSERGTPTASRSYHAAVPISNHKAVILGGRSTDFIENVKINDDFFDYRSRQCSVVSKFVDKHNELEEARIRSGKVLNM